MNESHKNNSLSTVVLSLLIVATIATSFFFWRDMNRLNSAYADIMKVESISSTTQRQINLASTGDHLQRDVFNIGKMTEDALSLDGEEPISLMSNPLIAVLADDVLQQWLSIEGILSVNWLKDGAETQELNYIDLQLGRDAHFKAMTDLSNGISAYTVEMTNNINQYQLMATTFVFLIGMIMLNSTLQTRAELRISKELAQKAQIDTATGLYNRSRCQELFKWSQVASHQRKPAIMVLDLNDLKKTNDTMGHRVGDELIYSFALILKNACAVHTISPFVGRYGGDEFIVYYEDIKDEGELQLYLKELEFLTQEYNSNETRYQVSYAVGYSFANDSLGEDLTIRQLFDKADEAMYINKVEGKRARNPNYDIENVGGNFR